jgi:N12 class adenine-specific DNA methylase
LVRACAELAHQLGAGREVTAAAGARLGMGLVTRLMGSFGNHL